MAWDTYRRGRHLSIQLPTPVKNELIKIKARGGGTLTEQIVSALQSQWSGAVQQRQNDVPPGCGVGVATQRLAPPSPYRKVQDAAGTTIYNGQVYKVQRPKDPKIPEWNL
jgi:hypothetical protein